MEKSMTTHKNATVLILWTCATLEEARRICHELVEKRLVACANLIPHVESIYLWEDKVENGNEVKVFLKTLDTHFENVKEHIQKNCTYDVPEVSKIVIDSGNPDYFQWVEKTVGKSFVT
jgi:periplasmic divalent cation tolerance protein